MPKWPGRVCLGLLAGALALAPLSGCQQGAGVTSSTPLTTFLPPTSTQASVTFVPPVVTTAISSSPPTLSVPAPPVAITTSAMPTTLPPDTTTGLPSTTPAEPTTSAPPTTTTTPVPVATLFPPEGAPKVEITDGRNDFFDISARPLAAEPCLDIIGAEVYATEQGYFFRLKLAGAVPARLDNPQVSLEWDFFIDGDVNPMTGWADALIANDTGPDYLLRLFLGDDWVSAQVYNVKTNKLINVRYQIIGDTIDFSFTPQELTLGRFNVVAATRKWVRNGQDSSLVAVDKAPDEGHYNVPGGYVYVKPGLPTMQFESLHATFWYNEGNEDRARSCAEAYELAYTEIGELWGIYPLHHTVYVYATQADLVKGLRQYSGLSWEEAAFYQAGGAPRPMKNISHISPGFDARAIFHQQGLEGVDLFC